MKNTIRDIELKVNQLIVFCRRIKWYNAAARVPQAIQMTLEIISMITVLLNTFSEALGEKK